MTWLPCDFRHPLNTVFFYSSTNKYSAESFCLWSKWQSPTGHWFYVISYVWCEPTLSFCVAKIFLCPSMSVLSGRHNINWTASEWINTLHEQFEGICETLDWVLYSVKKLIMNLWKDDAIEVSSQVKLIYNRHQSNYETHLHMWQHHFIKIIFEI